MKDDFKFQFADGWAHVIYENEIVTVTDDQGLFLKFAYPSDYLKEHIGDEVAIRSLLSLNVGCRISKIDVMRMIHGDLIKNLSVLEYDMAPLGKNKVGGVK